MCIVNLEMIHLANTSAQLMEALYVLAIGTVGTVPCIALRRMILKVIIVVIHEQDKGFVTKTGMEKIAAQTVFLKITTGLVITTAIRPTAVNSVIATGMDRVALSSARLAMILADITCVKRLMEAKFVWRTGLELSARGIAKQWITHKDTTIAVLKMGPGYVTNTGMGQTVRCIAHQEMTPRDIICVIMAMAVRCATPTGTVRTVLPTVLQGMTPRDIMIAGQ